MSRITNIRITDPYILELVEKEQERSREATPAKTAQRMIIERAAQRELSIDSSRTEQPAALAS